MHLVNLNNATSLSADVFNLAATLGIAGFAARLAREIHLPAPYLMGSLLGVWLSGGLIASFLATTIIALSGPLQTNSPNN
ncbi:MAG: hypothetical protein OXF29_03625 [Hyphomicrobiales bacterium]|nr:hypothetical protein [Hyphomicrobiales bacterium]